MFLGGLDRLIASRRLLFIGLCGNGCLTHVVLQRHIEQAVVVIDLDVLHRLRAALVAEEVGLEPTKGFNTCSG